MSEESRLKTYLQKKPWYRWYAVGVLTAVYASSQVDRQIMGMLLEPIRLELGASDTAMGFLVGLTFAIFYATLGMPIAMLADRTNRRNIIAIAITIYIKIITRTTSGEAQLIDIVFLTLIILSREHFTNCPLILRECRIYPYQRDYDA